MSPIIFPMHFFSRVWKPSVLALRVPDSFLALCKFFNSPGVSATCLCLAATSLHVKALFFNMLRGPCLQVSRTMVQGLYFLLNTLHSSLGAVYFLMTWQWEAEWLWSTRCLFDSLWRGEKEKASAICSAIDGECHQIQTKHVWIPSMITTVIFWSPVKNVCSLHEFHLKQSHFSMQIAKFFLQMLFSSGWALHFIDTCNSHTTHIVTSCSIPPPDCQEALCLSPDMFRPNKSPGCFTCS